MSVSILTDRGYERFVEKPLSVATNLGRSKPPTVFDQQRIAMQRLRDEESARIKNEEELKADLLDFSYLTGVDDYGLPLSTPYAVPEEVPDMYVPQASASPKDEDSVSKGGSDPEPSGGTE